MIMRNVEGSIPLLFGYRLYLGAFIMWTHWGIGVELDCLAGLRLALQVGPGEAYLEISK